VTARHHPRFAHLPTTLAGHDPAPLAAWAADRLAARGIRARDVTARRVRPWSIVLRLEVHGGTDARPVWAKAAAAGFAHEPALLALLAARAPGTALEPLAVDADGARVVLPDGGPTLRDRPATDPAATWHALLTGYAGVQRSLAALAADAAALGTPDVRGALAVDLLEPAVDAAGDPVHGPHRLTPAEAAALRALPARLADVAGALAAGPVPATVEHNDPHTHNVLAGSGRLFDFGDAVVGHPFLGLAGALPDAAADLGVPPAHPAVTALREAYLSRFTDLAPLTRLRADARAAVPLMHLVRAGTWLRVAPQDRGGWPAALPDRLRALLAATRTG